MGQANGSGGISTETRWAFPLRFRPKGPPGARGEHGNTLCPQDFQCRWMAHFTKWWKHRQAKGCCSPAWLIRGAAWGEWGSLPTLGMRGIPMGCGRAWLPLSAILGLSKRHTSHSRNESSLGHSSHAPGAPQVGSRGRSAWLALPPFRW